jgi:outer membrane lipoprotein-sorting protein
MAGRRQAAFIAVFVAGWVAAVAPGVAEPVPLPQRAPQPKSGTVPPPPSTVPNSGSSSSPMWLPSFLGGQSGGKPGTGFEPGQRALVDKASAYLSSVRVLSGSFNQISPDGRQTKGQFYILKPGKVRFEYDAPSPIEIVADGSSVVVRDRKLATQDVYPLSQTPLRFLLSDRIDLLKETNVVGVSADDLFVTVAIEEKQALIGTSRLMMMFGAKDMQLKQWVVTDPQGFDTTIAVSNLDSKSRVDPALFKIDYTRYEN